MAKQNPQHLPNGDQAVVEIEKLRDYCLNPLHLRGRHKAKVFATRLGLTSEDAEWLRDRLLQQARQAAVIPTEKDAYGLRYTLDFELTTPSGTAIIRSAWIVLAEEDFPRLTTCFVR